jgi:hypothetical protein
MEIYLWLAIAIIFAIILVNSRKKREIKKTSTYQYQKKGTVLTRAEGRFFERLTGVVGEKFIIIPQAHLSTFLDHKLKGQNWKGAFSSINGKSVDFLLVEKTTLKPVMAIELDDWSHKREDRIARDEKVKGILDSVGIVLARFDNPDISGQAIVDTVYRLVQEKDSGIQK